MFRNFSDASQKKNSCRIYRHTCAKLGPDQVLFVQEVEENLVIAQGLDLIKMTSSRFHLSCKVFSVHIHPSERTFTDILPCSTVVTVDPLQRSTSSCRCRTVNFFQRAGSVDLWLRVQVVDLTCPLPSGSEFLKQRTSAVIRGLLVLQPLQTSSSQLYRPGSAVTP